MDRYRWAACIEGDDTIASDADLCAREGWAVFNEDSFEARIEKIDVAGTLPHDAAAWDICCRKAVDGSEYHVAALEHVRRNNEEHFARIEEHIRDTPVDYLKRPQSDFDTVLAAVNQYAFSMMRHIVDSAENASGPRP